MVDLYEEKDIKCTFLSSLNFQPCAESDHYLQEFVLYKKTKKKIKKFIHYVFYKADLENQQHTVEFLGKFELCKNIETYLKFIYSLDYDSTIISHTIFKPYLLYISFIIAVTCPIKLDIK